MKLFRVVAGSHVSRDVWAWMTRNLNCWPAWGGSEEVHPERAWPRPGACARVTEVLAGECSRPGWVGRALTAGSVRVGSRGVVNHGPHVTAFGCRHDDLQRGSERFFHPSPTTKHPDVEQARWARGTAGAAAGYEPGAVSPPGFQGVTPYVRLSSRPHSPSMEICEGRCGSPAC